MTDWNLLRRVADHIKPDNFDMQTYAEQTGCGTVACVAGHVMDVTHPDLFRDAVSQGKVNGVWPILAQKKLGINDNDRRELFLASKSRLSMKQINNNSHLVPDALHWMADNERINWNEAFEAIKFKREERRP